MLARLLSLSLLFAPAAHAITPVDAPESWGEPLPQAEAQSLDQALAAFDPDAEQVPRVYRGRIVDVCSRRGCWAMLEVDGKAARVRPRDYGFMVPRDVRGEALVYGTLSVADLSEARAGFAQENPGEPNPIPESEYRIDALGVALVE